MDVFLDLLKVFIAFRSVGTDSAEKSRCLDWILTTFLSSSGLTPIRGEVKGSPYVFLQHPQPKLLWFGHTDVVPGSDDQFSLRVDGDRAYGRGVKDMKGADLTFLIAYKEACESGSIPPISVLLTSDEEVGGHTPGELLDQKILGSAPVAFTPDTGEADGIVTELKGALWAKLTATGTSGHAAMPWKSDNPVPRLMDAVRQLTSRFSIEGDWQVTVTPTQLFGSDAFNRIPGEASCVLDVRFPPEIWKTPSDALSALSALMPKDCRIAEVEHGDCVYCDPEHPMVLLMQRIGTAVTGVSVPVLREHGSSDARFFTARGIPAFLYGPVGGDLHGAKEWVSIASLEQHVEINRRLLKELSS